MALSEIAGSSHFLGILRFLHPDDLRGKIVSARWNLALPETRRTEAFVAHAAENLINTGTGHERHIHTLPPQKEERRFPTGSLSERVCAPSEAGLKPALQGPSADAPVTKRQIFRLAGGIGCRYRAVRPQIGNSS